MTYTPKFTAADVERFDSGGHRTALETRRVGDRREGSIYVYDDRIRLAINVALATDRPLLVRGVSGSGKSSLARSIAFVLERRYYETVVTSRTQARDLAWTFDAVQRLGDAAGGVGARPQGSYIRPGVLWWAFDPTSARAQAAEAGGMSGAVGLNPPNLDGRSAVVLIDEIDKADPDVPNDLLVPVGSLTFDVPDINRAIRATTADQPLIVITTNEERELPPAFLRRCVGLPLPPPTIPRLVEIAIAHHPSAARDMCAQIARQIVPRGPDGKPGTPIASTAEFLDAVQASLELQVEPRKSNRTWQSILDAILSKTSGPAPTA